MRDPIYVVDPRTRSTLQVSPTSFYDLNVKERQDLQAWLMNRPEVLGEPLLLLCSEFDRFDKSDKRLDLLLLDKNASIVIAELKLDASGTLADQQAIRYAAFCSTMTMQDAVELHARTSGRTLEDAVNCIREFLQTADLPELNGEPRIMLVAGTFNDQELTTTVMWLRKFGVDISCIELTPYRYPGDESNILLVPKTLIPLAEARDYQIGVERKERTEIARRVQNAYSEFFSLVLHEYGALQPEVKAPKNPSNQDWMSIGIGVGQIHYEWVVRKRSKVVDVALHFENGKPEINLQRMEEVLNACAGLRESFTYELEAGLWGKKWAQICLKVPYSGSMPDLEIAKQAALTMREFISRTLPAVRSLKLT